MDYDFDIVINFFKHLDFFEVKEEFKIKEFDEVVLKKFFIEENHF